jgi:hypothetical protein
MITALCGILRWEDGIDRESLTRVGVDVKLDR